ncbi:murein biosynthesis integral membrane protein MurJ [Candidatus Endomicrobiellum devescovinae]|jgi:putative peptidoglycan lipid II flippase|uniref:murein biosynthesis integral membrane protein MurJ n=1 Tax=Candidatus Endomicrobiellum devescovinae TaxID=3242322 RepID=UPI002830D67D|nr:murein biosynthesis integral membrane protein MurJ [Endomicrobium sp.]
MEHKTLIKNAGKTSFGTMLSRILGYIRDMLVAYFFGTGAFADAFYAAFKIPNLFRRIFGEGSFSAAFVPVFSEYLHTKDKSETQKFLNIVFTALFITLFVVSILGVFFAPALAKIIAWGFTNDPEKMQLTIDLTRLMFPFILFICLAAFLLAILNTLHSFFIPAFAPSMLSFSEIFYMLAVAPVLVSESQIKGLAVSVILGGALHFFIQYPKLKSLGWHLKFMLDLKHPGIKKIAILMLPSLVGLSVDQINAFVDNICATLISSGAVSALYYSNRVMQLPLAIFGLAFAAVSLPAMSKAYAQKDMAALKNSLNYSVRFINFALLPAAAGLMTVGLPIIKFLFEHGRFSYAGSIMTNNALFYYSLGLPAYAAAKIFANAFYSFQDTKTPVKTAIWAMILHIVLCMILMRPMGVGGLALATAVSSYFNFMLLAIYLRKRIGRFGLRLIIFSSCKSFISSIITAIVAWNACKVSDNLFISVPAAIVLSLAAFVVSSYILRSEELKTFKNAFVR